MKKTNTNQNKAKNDQIVSHKDEILSLNTYYQYYNLQLNDLKIQYKKEYDAHWLPSKRLKQLYKEIITLKSTLADINKQMSIIASKDHKESRFNILFDLYYRQDTKEINATIKSYSFLSNLFVSFIGLSSLPIILIYKLIRVTPESNDITIQGPMSFLSLDQQRKQFNLSLINTIYYLLLSIKNII